jgi:hypothetical protein
MTEVTAVVTTGLETQTNMGIAASRERDNDRHAVKLVQTSQSLAEDREPDDPEPDDPEPDDPEPDDPEPDDPEPDDPEPDDPEPDDPEPDDPEPDGLFTMAAKYMSEMSGKKRRVKVYELRGSDWFDLDTGICFVTTHSHMNCQGRLCVYVESEDHSRHILLETWVHAEDTFQR